MSRRTPRWRGLLAASLVIATGAPLLGAGPVLAAPPPAPRQANTLAAKADGAVLDGLARQDRVSFWVRLDSEAEASAAGGRRAKADKGRAVIEAKTRHAERTQAGLKALLRKEGARFTPYWISNTVKVTGDRALAELIAARDEVAAIEADVPVDLPDPLPGTEQAAVNGVEWGVDAIGAPRVWDELGVRGEGVVVGNIDTGVEYQHPALLRAYRGSAADGTVSHAYNWTDPTASCQGDAPCDDHGHGTHTMGTMVGDDGAGNRIGVAPGARWIAAKACTTLGCPQDALLAAGQWMLAPTDSRGHNPRPELAPDVINNSWGNGIIDTWYKSMVQAWRDAGIFPAFSGGNDGPDCATAGSPGAYTNAYASGAFDSEGRIAVFSSRGAGEGGAVKPDIAAPGVDVRSSVPGGGYALNSGTSMASPHTAAAVALLWSASPALRGDVAATELLLDRTAADTDDTSCGGTAADNNVWGQGRLDAYGAVDGAPRGPLGALRGTVTTGGAPLAGATVELTGPMYATATTQADGAYALPKVMVGDYTVTVSRFGYVTERTTATVTEGGAAVRDVALTLAPLGTLTGTVRTAGGPEPGAKIAVAGSPVVTTSGADGSYSLELPAGEHQLTITPTSRCTTVGALTVEVAEGTHSRDLALPGRSDKFGTTCRVVRGAAFPTGETRLNLTSPYSGSATIKLPFPVALYGRTYREVRPNIEGFLAFGPTTNLAANRSLPHTGVPNGSLYPFWDDLQLATTTGGIHWSTRGTAPHREVVVEWRDLVPSAARTQKLDFAVVIGEDGTYSYHYKELTGGAHALGLGATIAAENGDGTDALQFSYNEASLSEGMSIAFRPERSASVSGTVTDANDGKPVGGAAVTVTRAGEPVATGTTASDGAYLVQVPVTAGAEPYEVTVSASHYTTGVRTVALASGTVSRGATSLETGLVTVTPAAVPVLTVLPGGTGERSIAVRNSGSGTDYSVTAEAGVSWVRATPASGHLDKGGEAAVTLVFDTAGVTPGTVLDGAVLVASDSGRAPVIRVPVRVLVPAYHLALDTGADAQPADGWGPDRAWESGAYGHVGRTGTVSTGKAVYGTEDQEALRTARQGAVEYRFDGLPDGVYQIDLGFAELANRAAGERVFDVMAEGVERVAALDIVAETGSVRTALSKTFTVEVADGQLNLRFVAHAGKTLVNAVRVTERPDLGA
ncbi:MULTISPECIES: S8 family serine peptidase [unclassified Streptomyces]|uniref:S8 family serine peptidase n=1 Tax=unclassified Streptomyces TaxID=2593676 RepID=UPI0036F99DCE